MGRNFSIKDNLIIINGNTIKFSVEIRLAVCFGKVIVVMLDPSCGKESENNLLGFDENGKKIWKVSYNPEEKRNCPFVYMDEVSSNAMRLVLVDNCDCSVEVETLTGKILSREVSQW